MTTPKTAQSPTARKAVVAIVAASLGLAALTPAAFAAGPHAGNDDRQHRQAFRMDGEQGQGMRQGMRQGWGRHHDRNSGRMDMRMGPQAGRGMMLGLGCGPNAAERIEHALVSLSYRLDPTDEQTKLLDDLKTTALDAQQQYASVCDAVMPQRQAMAGQSDDAARPQSNILEMMQSRLQMEQARVTALGDILPKFEALYNSLSDEQKASLEPRFMQRNGRGFGPKSGAAPAPTAPATPEAPEAPLEPQNG